MKSIHVSVEPQSKFGSTTFSIKKYNKNIKNEKNTDTREN